MKVSIIVPVYNPLEKHLKECLDSLINQTLNDIEIILIDNCSTGKNPQILKEYAKCDNRIKLIVFEENKGYSGACNKGLELATGKYIQIVDSDDWLEQDAVDKLYNFMEQNTECDFCFFCANVFDDKLSLITDNSLYYFKPLEETFGENKFTFDDAKSFILHLPSQAWNKFYRKAFLLNSGNYFDEELKTVLVDALFSFKNYINANGMMLCNKILYNYRVNLQQSVVSSIEGEYTNKPILFCQKLEKIQQGCGIKNEESTPFVRTSLEALHWFYNLYNAKNKKIFYKDLHNYFSNNDKTIYTEENIISSGLYSWYKTIISRPYPLFKFLNFIYNKIDKKDYFRIKIFGVTMYKKVKQNDFIKYKFLGIFKFRKNIN